MDRVVVCPRCEREIPDSSDGNCPACLLALVMSPREVASIDDESFEELAYRSQGIEIVERIAEGGMGTVYMAHQPELDRLVALKVLRKELRDNPALTEQFLAEVRVAGALQHPGIIPIYGSGALDELPYFTMRLIDGQTLAEALAQGGDRAKYVEVFQRVCQAVAYAHSRGIVHRDLKPNNVMLGDFGEVLVVDWGLARALGTGHDEIEFDRDALSSSIVGTPAYMSPEQARGDLHAQDQRCDVFGLGAILCEILTGRPPYIGATDDEVRAKARAGDTADAHARIAASGADEELRDLATSCLATTPGLRPRDAGAVASAISAYEARVGARLAAANEARLRAEVRSVEERKRWGLVVLLLALGMVGVVAWLADRSAKASREADVARSLALAIEDVHSLRAKGRSAEARASLRKVEGLLSSLGEPRRREFASRLADLEMLEAMDGARFRPSQAGPGRLLHVESADAYEKAFRRYGIDPEAIGEATISKVKTSPIRDDLVRSLDDWAKLTREPERKRRLRDLADAADADPKGFASRLRRALLTSDRAAFGELASSLKVEDQSASSLASLGGALLTQRAFGEAVDLLRKAQVRYPDDFWINVELAAALMARSPQDRTAAEGHLTAALALSRRDPGTYFYLGSALHDVGRLPEAVDAYNAAIAIRPDYAEAYCNLGNALTAQRKVDEAIAAFRRAIQYRSGYALAYFNMGYALDERERYDESSEAYREAVRLRPDYPEALCNLGLAEYRMGRFAPAVEALDRGIAQLPATQPMIPYWKSVAGMGHSLLKVEPLLADVLKGGPAPSDVTEIVGLARLCAWRNRRLFLRAARLYQAAFQANPKLAENLIVGDRYAAAQSAAAAGCGQGEDVKGVGDAERAELRNLALGWLRADLDLREKEIASPDKAVRERAKLSLLYWLRDPNYAGLREPDALAQLPEAERADWMALWSKVRELVR